MAWDFGSSGMSWFGNISEKFDNLCSDMDSVNCQVSLRYVGNQLLAVGTHVVEFWSEILHDVQVKEEEAPNLSDSQTPTAGVVKEELSNVSPLPKLNFEEPDKELHRDSSLGQNAVVGNEESCWNDAKLSSMQSFEIVEFNSSVDGKICKPLDVNAEVSRDLQAIVNSIVFNESCESKFSGSGVSSDDVQSTFSVGKSDVASTKEVMDHEDACAERVMDHHVTEEGTETDQSKLNKLERDESFILVDSNENSSVCDLEKIIPASVKFVEKKEIEQQNQPDNLDAEQNKTEENSNSPSFPSLESDSLDEECESDWVVV